MKQLWVFMLIAATMGSVTAWSINYSKYARRVNRFGPFTMDGDITPNNVMAFITKDVPEGVAQVEIEKTHHDFGTMPPGSEGTYSFSIKNIGDADLRLRLGATTCKCTLGDLDREALGPGESTQITLTWTVKEGDINFAQSAQVITNDPSRVVIQFEVTGKIVDEIDVVPQEFVFGELATGENLELKGKIYNFLPNDIRPTDMNFSSEAMMSRVIIMDITEFRPTEADGIHSGARQGFNIDLVIGTGLKQGEISQNFVFGFRRLDENGEELPPAPGDNDPNDYVYIPIKGQIVGPMSMILSSKLTGQAGGGYMYQFGRIGKDDSPIAKTFVVLKGKEREKTKLRVGDIFPKNNVRATLGEPVGRGSMTLYPLEIEIIPGEDGIERMGKNSQDYGMIWIESDNNLVPRMRIALKFSAEGR